MEHDGSVQLVRRVVDDFRETDVGSGEQCTVVCNDVVDIELHGGRRVRDVIEERVIQPNLKRAILKDRNRDGQKSGPWIA